MTTASYTFSTGVPNIEPAVYAADDVGGSDLNTGPTATNSAGVLTLTLDIGNYVAQWSWDGSLHQTSGEVAEPDTLGEVAARTGGGTSGAGLQQAVLDFEEVEAAGEYVATLDLEAGAVVVNYTLEGLAPWAAGTAVLDIGDTANPTGYCDGFDLLNSDGSDYHFGSGPYDPADVATYDLADAVSMAQAAGSTSAAYAYAATDWANGTIGIGVPYPTADTITATLTTTGGATPTGHTRLRIWYFTAVTPTVASQPS